MIEKLSAILIVWNTKSLTQAITKTSTINGIPEKSRLRVDIYLAAVHRRHRFIIITRGSRGVPPDQRTAKLGKLVGYRIPIWIRKRC